MNRPALEALRERRGNALTRALEDAGARTLDRAYYLADLVDLLDALLAPDAPLAVCVHGVADGGIWICVPCRDRPAHDAALANWSA